MRTWMCCLFTLILVGASGTDLFTAHAIADPGDNNGNHFGQIINGNNGNHYGQINNGSNYQGSVPIPETFALFGAGFAALIVWQISTRRKPS
jgi:hypothetical protein